MFWIMIWLFSMLLFLLLPIVCVEKHRKLWWRRLTSCRWQVDIREGNNRTSTASPTNQAAAADYVLSKAQEDRIRESFLMEKLRMFTISLTSQMISKSEEEGNTEDTQAQDFQRVSTNQTTSSSGASSEEDDIETGSSRSGNVAESMEETIDTKNADSNDDPEKQQPQSDDESDESGLMDVTDDFQGDGSEGWVVGLPLAGDCRHDLLPAASKTEWVQTRRVTNGCSICLSGFRAGERLSWSSNPACEHVFHHNCILDWLQISGHKFLKKVRRDELRGRGLENIPNDPIERITAFPMQCPCCRQLFVVQVDEEEDESSNVEKDNHEAEEETGTGESDEAHEALQSAGDAAV